MPLSPRLQTLKPLADFLCHQLPTFQKKRIIIRDVVGEHYLRNTVRLQIRSQFGERSYSTISFFTALYLLNQLLKISLW